MTKVSDGCLKSEPKILFCVRHIREDKTNKAVLRVFLSWKFRFSSLKSVGLILGELGDHSLCNADQINNNNNI